MVLPSVGGYLLGQERLQLREFDLEPPEPIMVTDRISAVERRLRGRQEATEACVEPIERRLRETELVRRCQAWTGFVLTAIGRARLETPRAGELRSRDSFLRRHSGQDSRTRCLFLGGCWLSCPRW